MKDTFERQHEKLRERLRALMEPLKALPVPEPCLDPIIEQLSATIEDLHPSAQEMYESRDLLRAEQEGLKIRTLDSETVTVHGHVVNPNNGSPDRGVESVIEVKEAEQRLRESREQLRLALNAAHAGAWNRNLHTGEVRWTDQCYEIYGIPRAELADYNTWLDRVHPEDRPAAHEMVSRVINQNTPLDMEFRIVLPDGNIRWLESKGRILTDESGRPTHLTGITVDITERKEAEKARDEYASKLNRLLQVSRKVFSSMTLDEILKQVVEAGREMTGAKVGVAAHGFKDGKFRVRADSKSETAPPWPPGVDFTIQKGGVYLDIIEQKKTIRYTDQELRNHPFWWGLPDGHTPLRGLAGTPLFGRDYKPNGLIMFSDKMQGGDFTEDDAVLLQHLASIASLGLQHIEARVEADQRAAEAEEGKRTLDALMEHVPEGISIADSEAKLRMVSRHGLRMAGGKREDFEGVPAEVHAEKWGILKNDGITRPAPEEFALVRATRHGEIIINEEWVMRHPDGEKLSLLCNAGPIRDREGRITGGVIAWRDISSLKAVQEELRKSRDELDLRVQERTAELRAAARMLEGFFTSTITPFALISRSFNFVRVNEAFAGAAQRDASRFPGHNFFDLYPSNAKKLFERVLATKTPHQSIAKPFLFSDQPERGMTYWDWTLTPILDESGEVESLMFSANDVTERKRAKEALMAEYMFRNAIEESVLSGIVAMDLEGKQTYVNSAFCRMVGWSPKKLIGKKPPYPYITSEEMKSLAENVLRSRPLPGSLEIRLRRRNGEVFDALLLVSPLKDPEGKAIGWVGSVGDITERKRAEKALQQSEAQLRYLSSRLFSAQENERKRVARELHDGLGQFLTAVKFKVETYLQSARRRKKETLLPLEQAISFLQEGVREIRRIQSNLRPPVLDDLGILAAVSSLLREFGQTYPHIRIESEIGLEERDVSEDQKMVVYRVLQESLTNVAKHSEATLVKVSFQKKGQAIELSIRDNGGGFDLQEVISKREGAKGLGLASMRERIEDSGGAFMFESMPGKGTLLRAIWIRSDGMF